MMSETAFFVKDVVGPKGCVSIVSASGGARSKSGELESHCKTESLLVHHADLGPDDRFTREDETIDLHDEPNHQELVEREQRHMLRVIRENIDMTSHLNDAVNTLRIVLAADESVRTGRTVELS